MLAAAIICASAKVAAFDSTSAIVSNKLEKIVALAKHIAVDQKLCIDSKQGANQVGDCISLKKITRFRQHSYYQDNLQLKYIEFPLVLDLKAIQQWHKGRRLSKLQQRRFIQAASKALNQLSVNSTQEKLRQIDKTKEFRLTPIAINNSLLVTPTQVQSHNKDLQQNIVKQFKTSLSDEQAVVGIIDSGVSQYHHSLTNVEVIQFNPVENSFQTKDTAFGHATAILSLLAVEDNATTNKRLIENGKYLSCNGLPNAKYSFTSILQCMNWLFMQPRVDVVINAWSLPKTGCVDAWRYPITILFYANSTPVFSAGNYANQKEKDKGMNRSPANLDFSDAGFTSLTVGALNTDNKRLSSSSYGESLCRATKNSTEPTLLNKHFQANVYAKGSNLVVAVPFTKDSFQVVEGTSYAVVFVAAAVAKLNREFPLASSQQISQAILVTAKAFDLNASDNIQPTELGYGILDYNRARKYLSNRFKSLRPVVNQPDGK